MREMIKMVIVLTLLSCCSGGLLAAVQSNTQERIDNQVLKFVQGPAIEEIMVGADNNPIRDRFTIDIEDTEKDFFVGVYDGKPNVVAFETKAGGYSGDVGIMVAVNVETGKIQGISATKHTETPGVGARVEDDEDFKNQFNGLPIGAEPQVEKDGGDIMPMSGATITSQAVCKAVQRAGDVYEKVESTIKDKISTFSG